MGKAQIMNRKSASITGLGQSEEAVTYARVSSKDQEREGSSIPAQRETPRDIHCWQGLQSDLGIY